MKESVVFNVHNRKDGNVTVLIDAEDWPRVREYTWYIARKRGEIDAIVTNTWGGPKHKTKCLKLHRLIMQDVPAGADVAHRDGNPLNNRKYNLYLCKTYNRKPVLRRGKPVRYKGE